jgi:DNA-binding beta-propeller fold protein YncE
MSRILTLAAALFLSTTTASAQIAISANESKVVLVDGVVTVVKSPPPDTVTILDLGVTPPKVLGELPVPASIIGPPQSVAIAPNQPLALVTAATKIDPADATRTIPDDRVTLIDFKVSPPAVVGTVRAGAGASGVSFNPAGTLALVANRIEGTVSIFTVSGHTLTAAGKVDLGAPESGPSHVVFTRDGKRALVTRNNDSLISILDVDGTKVTYAKRDIAAGLKPYSIEVSPTADLAVVGNIGAGATGGADTISLIDLGATPPRAIEHATVGPGAEAVAISPDGRYVSVTVMNGSNQAKSSPLFNPNAWLRVYSIGKKSLVFAAEAPIGQWCQGMAWSRDSRTVVAQCAANRTLHVFRFDGKRLTPAKNLELKSGPSGIRTER